MLSTPAEQPTKAHTNKGECVFKTLRWRYEVSGERKSEVKKMVKLAVRSAL